MAGEAGSTLWSVQNARQAGSRLVSPVCCASGEGSGGMMLRRPVTWLKALAFLPFMAGPAPSLTCPEQTAELLFMTHQELPESYRSEEHTSELQSRENLVCRLLLEKKKIRK